MKKLAIFGLGHIGKYVYDTIDKNEFEVEGFDISQGHDFNMDEVVRHLVKKFDGVLASTPFYVNKRIAAACNDYGVDYFDLTESIDVSQFVAGLQNSKFIPQCGLAPGMVSVIANNMAKEFEEVRDIHIRVGALPQTVNNYMRYNRTWNTEGLINEYCNLCITLKQGHILWADPLTDQETIFIDGIEFEAANTSGGIGTLANTYTQKAETVNYKSLRYPGHFQIIRALKNDLGMKKNFNTFVDLFNKNIPETNLDVVYVVVNVSGYNGDKFSSRQYIKTIKSNTEHTAIQIATGSGVLAVIDSWNKGNLDSHKGLLKQEDLDYNSIFNSKYAECYR